MKRRVLFFFPQNLYPAKSGAHRNTLEILAGLRDIGCHVTLASWAVPRQSDWNPTSIDSLKREWVDDVCVYTPSLVDAALVGLLYGSYTSSRRPLPIDSRIYAPPGFCRWFGELVQGLNPDVIFMNYAYWDRLLDRRQLAAVTSIMHTHDLVSLNRRMQSVLQRHLRGPLIGAFSLDDDVLQENFFDRLDLHADPKETRIYDRYDYTIAVSAREAEYIRQHTSGTRIRLMPVTQKPCYMPNRYDAAALFPVGPNLFNVQGYFYFVKRVLPRIRKYAPSFSLHITGSWPMNWQPVPEDGVVWRGFVPELTSVYQASRFGICPVFGQTGQQVKIVEAMAHGLPVVALKAAAESSPLQHGVNGLIAHDANEFAEHVVQLWMDTTLCRQLGEAARATIATQFSRDQLVGDLTAMLANRAV